MKTTRHKTSLKRHLPQKVRKFLAAYLSSDFLCPVKIHLMLYIEHINSLIIRFELLLSLILSDCVVMTSLSEFPLSSFKSFSYQNFTCL